MPEQVETRETETHTARLPEPTWIVKRSQLSVSVSPATPRGCR